MAACPKCKTSYSGGARLCRNCGGALPPADAPDPSAVANVLPLAEAARNVVPPSEGVRVCVDCGRSVPAKHASCGPCGGVRATRIAPRRPDGAYWVRVTCEYHCTGCKSRVPLRSFSADGGSECVLCRHVQDQPTMFWRMVLKHAHAVGDLAGADVARNPYRNVGIDVGEVEDEPVRADDDMATQLVAGPGHPVCLRCRAPIDDAWIGGASACAGCGLTVTSVLPKKASPVDRGLVAILIRTSAPAASRGAAGAIALTCPTCNAPLTLEPGATEATCKYCKATSLVARPASRHADAADGAGAADAACWMLFKGPSKKRTELSPA